MKSINIHNHSTKMVVTSYWVSDTCQGFIDIVIGRKNIVNVGNKIECTFCGQYEVDPPCSYLGNTVITKKEGRGLWTRLSQQYVCLVIMKI